MDVNWLLRNLEHQKAALFIGAGAARCDFLKNRQLPDGTEMMEQLLTFHYKHSNDSINTLKETFVEELNSDRTDDMKIDKDDLTPEFVWEICLGPNCEDLPQFTGQIQNMFCNGKFVPPNYKFIAWLHFEGIINQIVTTNFDEKLEEAYTLLQQRNLYKADLFYSASHEDDYNEITPNLLHTKIIYKLHGTISKPYSIKASDSEMRKEITGKRFAALERVFKNNNLVIFLGYACEDSDVRDALMKIAKNTETRIIWVKRNEKISEDSSIYKVLRAFNNKKNDGQWSPIDDIIKSNSYDFLLTLFNFFINRDDIDFPIVQNQTKGIIEKLNKDTNKFLVYETDDYISDFLYKKIEFPDKFNNDMFRLINSFDLQRLRDIKQLSSAQYKFPSATHSRFSHSLGVAHLASKVLSNRHLKYTTDEDKKNTICAALLHDIGHGPLGHVLDKFFDRLGKDNEHENFTEMFIDRGLFDLGIVLHGIHINIEEVQKRVSFKNNQNIDDDWDKFYLSCLISDYALDLDRIDFLARDFLLTMAVPDLGDLRFPSKKSEKIRCLGNSFSNYGTRDILNDIIDDYTNRLTFATYHDLDEKSQEIIKILYPENVKLLCIDDDDDYNYRLEDLIDFLLSLYCHMYINVYYDDKVACAEAMLAKALHIAYELGDIDRSSLYKYNDSELMTYLENLESDLLRQIIYSVKYRRLLTPIAEFDLDISPDLTAEVIEKKIENKFKLSKFSYDSLVVVHVPRRKELHNLFIKKNGKVTLYSGFDKFNSKLSTIKGKIFVNPLLLSKSSLDVLTNDCLPEKELITFLKMLGLNAKLIRNKRVTFKETTLDNF